MRRLLSSAERTTPLRRSRTRSHLPKRELLRLRHVLALPKASSTGLEATSLHHVGLQAVLYRVAGLGLRVAGHAPVRHATPALAAPAAGARRAARRAARAARAVAHVRTPHEEAQADLGELRLPCTRLTRDHQRLVAALREHLAIRRLDLRVRVRRQRRERRAVGRVCIALRHLRPEESLQLPQRVD